MPWKEVSVMSQRLEFVQMPSSEQANIRQLCRHFKIAAPTAYKWLRRFQHSTQQQSLLDHGAEEGFRSDCSMPVLSASGWI